MTVMMLNEELTEGYVTEVNQLNPVGKAEERRLIALAQAGSEEDFKHIMLRNQRLVMSRVPRFIGRGLSSAELIQEGNIGLMKAIREFNLALDYKLSTYAVWWIDQAMRKATQTQGLAVRLPALVNQSVRKLRVIESRLGVQLGREPMIRELAEEMGVSEACILEWQALGLSSVSLDTEPSTEVEASSWYDILPNSDEETLEESATDSMFSIELLQALQSTLSEREMTVLMLRYVDELTYREIGQQFNLSHERIRQIIKEAFERVRQSNHGRALEQTWLGD